MIDRNALKFAALLMTIQPSAALTSYTVTAKFFLLEIIGFLNKELGPLSPALDPSIWFQDS